MAKIAKVLILQIFWYLSVINAGELQYFFFFVALFLIALNYIFYCPQVSIGHYLFSLIFFVIYGYYQETLFEKLGLVDYRQESFPLWLTSLYIVFLGYYGDLFNYLAKKPKIIHVLMGAVGGFMAYYGGVKISPIEALSPFYYVAVALGWGIFFPLSMMVFYEGFMWNKLLDASIYWSFDLTGFKRHQKNNSNFQDRLHFKSQANALITGGTSGIGAATALELDKQGVQVFITGRSPEKGNDVKFHGQNISFVQWDMADWSQIEKVVSELGVIDYLVLNAGGMPENFESNAQGIELQFASQLFGHYYLALALKKANKLAKDARIVWVTSGGMYLSPLIIENIKRNDMYNKVSQYANVKRAQVTLLPHLKETFPDQITTAMHPGWVDTPGVDEAIPGFKQKMHGRLREPLEGADTILWLLCKEGIESGGMYFDRKKVKTHYFWFTKKSDQMSEHLIHLLEENKPDFLK